MKLYGLIPFLLAPLAASVAIPDVNNGVVNANTDATPATGAVENFATYTDVTTLEAHAEDAATLICNNNYDCGFGALCLNGKCIITIDFPPELATRDEETNLGTEGEPRHCNNINKWCLPHEICYRSICVTPGALAVRADEALHEEARCRMNMDCPPSQSCVRGQCRGRIPPSRIPPVA
ncbi:hypothetical protein CNMCM5793_005604 [Aspergillus hiratsukae]|uniref:Dickkopf N-terminal cysteine-rich domain-containing protein n=1 Tax=Aspergillus hiratsukae TaxID=1194566 RepID=A0A8H6QEW8_9EURO|nr:hypothetical protein CNMCM5793_005604 [Aspergillus hiratsukae]KAF7171836.1 hypothetical protein CNMCM6106_006174 [Aspergillus hiratsukae]